MGILSKNKERAKKHIANSSLVSKILHVFHQYLYMQQRLDISSDSCVKTLNPNKMNLMNER